MSGLDGFLSGVPFYLVLKHGQWHRGWTQFRKPSLYPPELRALTSIRAQSRGRAYGAFACWPMKVSSSKVLLSSLIDFQASHAELPIVCLQGFA